MVGNVETVGAVKQGSITGSTSLMGGGAQAGLYILMSEILKAYSQVRRMAAELAKAQVSMQSTTTSYSMADIRNSGKAQAETYFTQAGQALGGMGASVAQIGLNSTGKIAGLQAKSDELGTTISQQKTLLDMVQKPSVAATSTAGTTTPAGTTTTPLSHAQQQAQQDLIANLGAKPGRGTTHDQAAIDDMPVGGPVRNKFEQDLKEAIKHNEEQQTGKIKDINNAMQRNESFVQFANQTLGSASNFVQGALTNSRATYDADKALEEYLAQSAGSAVQTFTGQLQQFHDVVAGIIQATAAAARANPQ